MQSISKLDVRAEGGATGAVRRRLFAAARESFEVDFSTAHIGFRIIQSVMGKD